MESNTRLDQNLKKKSSKFNNGSKYLKNRQNPKIDQNHHNESKSKMDQNL